MEIAVASPHAQLNGLIDMVLTEARKGGEIKRQEFKFAGVTYELSASNKALAIRPISTFRTWLQGKNEQRKVAANALTSLVLTELYRKLAIAIPFTPLPGYYSLRKPYISRSAFPLLKKCFNGTPLNSPMMDDFHQFRDKLACTHFSAFYAEGSVIRRKFNLVEELGENGEKVLNKVRVGSEFDFRAKCRPAIIKNDEFGRWVIDLFNALMRASTHLITSRNWICSSALVETYTHALAVRIMIKVPSARRATEFVLHFFDPNRTLVPARTATSNLDAFRELKFSDMLAPLQISEKLYGCCSVLTVSTPLFDTPARTPKISSPLDWCDALAHAMRTGLDKTVMWLGETLAELHLDKRGMQAVLWHLVKNLNVLCVALQDGHSKAIDQFGEILTDRIGLKAISRETLVCLLTQSVPGGSPAFGRAICWNYAAAFESYMNLFHRCCDESNSAKLFFESVFRDRLNHFSEALGQCASRGSIEIIESMAKVVTRLRRDDLIEDKEIPIFFLQTGENRMVVVDLALANQKYNFLLQFVNSIETVVMEFGKDTQARDVFALRAMGARIRLLNKDGTRATRDVLESVLNDFKLCFEDSASRCPDLLSA